MSKIGNYLQEHLNGELIENSEIRKYFSMDQGPLQVVPSFVAFPADERDVRKINRFCFQLSQRGKYVPITARGYGSSFNGSSLSSGLIMSTTNYLNKILVVDNKSGLVVVEAGINYSDLNKQLRSQGLYLPFKSDQTNLSLGGIISGNYGSIENHVKRLRIVLSNGEILVTENLNEKELSKKMGQLNFEGEIYRAVDAILEENKNLSELSKNISSSSAGYALDKIKNKNGFDLTPLFIGAEGTLGVITEVTIKTEILKIEDEKYLLASFENYQDLSNGLNVLNSLSIKPDSIEFFDESVFESLDFISPNLINNWITKPYSKAYLLIGFMGVRKNVDKGLSKTMKHLNEVSSNIFVVDENESEISLKHKLFNLKKVLLSHYDKGQRGIRVIDSMAAPLECIKDLLNGLDILSRKLNIRLAISGNISEGNISVISICDINEIGDRQSFFKLLHDSSDLVISLGGSMSSEGGRGRTLTPYMNKEFNPQMILIFKKIKDIFDPQYILNPNVKFDTTEDQIKELQAKTSGDPALANANKLLKEALDEGLTADGYLGRTMAITPR
jgi:FAD/FMN-containing dehydrogenase